MSLGVCAIFKDEALNLPEWLAFHTAQGVDHFYLYNNDSTDDWRAALKPWDDKVTVQDWPGPMAQLPAYQHALRVCRSTKRVSPLTNWLAFIDIDEYLFSPQGCLPDQLDHYLDDKIGGVAVHWMCFGPCGHKVRPKGLTIEAYTERPANTFGPNRHVKSIVRPYRVSYFNDPHHCKYSCGRCVDELGWPVDSATPSRISHEYLRINHYFTRSWAEWEAKAAKGRVDVVGKRDRAEASGYDIRDVTDLLITEDVPVVKSILAERYGVHK